MDHAWRRRARCRDHAAPASADSLTPPLRRRARELFAGALETPGGLKVQTIHALCARLLQRVSV
ncbi:MAG: hypothetical protein MZV49_20925 [Rhodopseudomonas palustris]|nr:hypothetical protein [Rhodopseudomonas palustris]